MHGSDNMEALLQAVLQQVEVLIQRAIPAGAAAGPIQDLGLLDPEPLPAAGRFQAFKRLGESLPDLATTGLLDSKLVALLGLRIGLMGRLLGQAKAHAETRIMFQRPLAHQTSIRLRLIELKAKLWLLEDVSATCAKLGDDLTEPSGAHGRGDLLAWLRKHARWVQNGCQQVTGGTGYMMESPIAQSVRALERTDAVMRALEANLGLCPQFLPAESDLLRQALLRHPPVSSLPVDVLQELIRRGLFPGCPSSTAPEVGVPLQLLDTQTQRP